MFVAPRDGRIFSSRVDFYATAATGPSAISGLIARAMTADLRAERDGAVARAGGQNVDADLVTKGVRFGMLRAHPSGLVDRDRLDGVDADLIVRPLRRKSAFTSLRQFTINALDVHHGMVASERFGACRLWLLALSRRARSPNH